MMFSRIRVIMQRAKIYSNEVVLSVPGYWGDKERKAILDAATIANFKIIKLTNNTTAGNYLYFSIIL